MPVEACPKCSLVDRVRPKLLTHNLLRWHPDAIYSAHEVCDEQAFRSSPFVVGEHFISALFCERCGCGFIPDSRTAELGVGLTRGRPI